jgi:hypothetical protein
VRAPLLTLMMLLPALQRLLVPLPLVLPMLLLPTLLVLLLLLVLLMIPMVLLVLNPTLLLQLGMIPVLSLLLPLESWALLLPLVPPPLGSASQLWAMAGARRRS